jgi:hypothetical protein|tara:strand:- start:185 stop:442 length:258 start_codon:yes stop_codon:yes gene_type:complete
METLFNLIAKATHSTVFSGKKNGTVFGKSFIVRHRKSKHRFQVSKGECFNIFHCYKWAFYVQHNKSRSISFKNIKDINGTEGVAA